MTKITDGVATQYVYDRSDIVGEVDGRSVAASYLRSLNIDEPFIRQTGTSNEHYHTDALGSGLALSNAQGNSIITYIYEPFGKTVVSGTSANTLQFTARENDGESLYFFRARYYSATLQRFLSEDVIGFAGGLNVFSYADNNPLTWKDPLGLMSMRPIIPRVPPPPAAQPKPPGWNPTWEWRYPATKGEPRWFDPRGGEWRWHAPDKWHPNGHWDYNPWDSWNSPWQNVPPGVVPPAIPAPSFPAGGQSGNGQGANGVNPGIGSRKDPSRPPIPDWRKRCAQDPICS